MTSQIQMHLGKNKLTKELLEELKKRFEKPSVKNIKISVLRSVRDSKQDVKKYADEIIDFLGNKFTYRTIGFSIFVLKMRKEQR